MLGTRTKPKPKKDLPISKLSNGATPSGETCVVSKGTIIDGVFQAKENVRLDGTINGEVRCNSRLVVGENGLIAGDVTTQDAIVMGTIEGDLRVNGTLTLKGTAFIKGGIHAQFLAVEEGARYVGECSIGN